MTWEGNVGGFMLIFEIAGGVVLGGVVLFFLHAMFLHWVEEQQFSWHLRQLAEEREQARPAQEIGAATREACFGGLRPDPTGRQRFAAK